MIGYYFSNADANPKVTLSITYAGVVKTGNKITFALAGEMTLASDYDNSNFRLGYWQNIPAAVMNKLIPYNMSGFTNVIAQGKLYFASEYDAGGYLPFIVQKGSTNISPVVYWQTSALPLATRHVFRLELTFLLSDNMAA